MVVIKDINFTPEYVFQKHIKNKKRAAAAFTTLIVIISITAVFLIPQLIYKYYEMQELTASQELLKLNGVKKKMNILQEIKSNMDQKKQILSEIQKSDKKVTQLVDKVRNGIPNNIEIKSHSFSGNDLNISFEVSSPSDTVRLIDSLEKLQMFDKIEINNFPIVDMKYTINTALKVK